MITEALTSGDTGYVVAEYGHGIIRDGTQAWHWCPLSHKQLANTQEHKCRPGDGQK